jgi:DNA-binding transcriptional ArsR family regulator
MAIFERLAKGPLAVNELAGMMPVSRPAVSQHLKVLKDAGLVTDSKSGTRRVYKLSPEGIVRLRAHFDRVWDRALSSFQAEAEGRTADEPDRRQRGKGDKHDTSDQGRSRRS